MYLSVCANQVNIIATRIEFVEGKMISDSYISEVSTVAVAVVWFNTTQHEPSFQWSQCATCVRISRVLPVEVHE
jgi:hypothetical protein